MKRILGLSSIPLDDRIGAGAERIANLYRYLPARYERSVLAFCGLRAPRGDRLLAGDVREIRLPSPAQTAFYYMERLRLVPFFRVAHAHELAPGRVRRYLRGGYDLVQFDSLWLTPWRRLVPKGTPVVYASHNFETDWYAGEIRRFPLARSHARFLSDLERRAVEGSDRVLAVTEEDREKFAAAFAVDRDKIVVVPNGFDDERFRPASADEKREARRALGLPAGDRIALFAGSDVAPNRDAVLSIIRSIAPKAPPGIRFVVAGSAGRSFAGERSERVIVTGPVPDIVPFFRAADLGLNPVRFGSGSNIKVLQYLGSGLPVISTDFGMRGFEDLRRHVTVARLDRFFYHLDRVRPDGEATRSVRDRHSWKSATSALAAVYAELLREDAEEGGKAAQGGRSRPER